MASSDRVLVHFLDGGERIVAVDEPPLKGAPLDAVEVQGDWVISDLKIVEDENALGAFQFEVWVVPAPWSK